MAGFNFASLAAPVSDAEPCGPDLDLAGDPDFMNRVARLEGALPESFFSFDRATLDYPVESKALWELLETTRDLRVLVIFAKLAALYRDLPTLSASVETIADLLDQRWDDVHPQAMDGDFGLRAAILQTLDDTPHMVLPLQYIPLARSRRFGPVSYRTHLIATGQINPREGEETAAAGTVEAALGEIDLPDLVATRDQIAGLQQALVRIRTGWLERAGYDQAVAFDRLPPVVDKICALIEDVLVKRDPGAVTATAPSMAAESGSAPTPASGASASAPPPAVQGSIASAADAGAALAAAAAYFARSEPSSPALLLVRQAEQLMGKSFFEAMQLLVPSYVEQAMIQVGTPRDVFELPVERLSALLETEAEGSEKAETAPNAQDFTATTRHEATALLKQVGTYFRTAEPSSPIPWLTDRATDLAQRDFLSLLKDVLPEDTLKRIGPDT